MTHRAGALANLEQIDVGPLCASFRWQLASASDTWRGSVYPLSPVMTMPWTKNRCVKKNNSRMGVVDMTTLAIK